MVCEVVTVGAGTAGGKGAGGDSTPGLGTILVIVRSASTTGTAPKAAAGAAGDLTGKSGVVFAVGGAPVKGGADGLAGAGGSPPEAGRVMLGIGLVTAVDHAGGALVVGTGSNWPDVLMGIVVAAEILGRGVAGVIFDEDGLRGRGGRLMRSVSRLGAFGSEPAESAIIILFYSYFGKCSMAKFAIVTYLWS